MWSPERSVIATARAYRRQTGRAGLGAKLARRLIRYRHYFWSAVSGSDIVLGATLGERLRLPHPNGVVIHEDAVIGDDCMIMQQVTIGIIDGPPPTIGNKVYIGAGAKLLGSIRVGDGARIGANAVVLADVPDNATAIGIPARILTGKE